MVCGAPIYRSLEYPVFPLMGHKCGTNLKIVTLRKEILEVAGANSSPGCRMSMSPRLFLDLREI